MANMTLFQVTSVLIGAIGIVLYGVGLFTTYTITIKLKANDVECIDFHKGFWKECIKDCLRSDYNCGSYDDDIPAAPGLGITAWILAGLAMGGIGLVFSTSDLERKMVYIGVSSVAYFFAGVLGLAGGIYFVVKQKEFALDKPHYYVEVGPGWSAYMLYAGAIVFLIESTRNAVFACRVYRSR